MKDLRRKLTQINAVHSKKFHPRSFLFLRRFALICGMVFLPGLVSAEAGYTSANFLKIGMGARSSAMADSFTAVADDATALYWNPAGLALVKGTSLSTTHGQWLQGVTNDYIVLSHQLEGNSVLGLGFVNQSTQTFNSALEDSLGNYAGQGTAVSASDWAFSAAYGDRLGHWIKEDFLQNTYAGLKATLVGQNALTSVGNAISFEVGILQAFPEQRVTLGFDVQNVGTAIQDRSQPVLFKAGASWYRPHNLTEGDKLVLAAEFDVQDDTGPHPSFGTEYSSPLARDFSGALRAGVRPTDEQYGFSFLTFGAGIVKSFNGFNAGLDYAFVPYGAIGPTHRFTLNLSLVAAEAKLTAFLEGPSHFNLDSLVSLSLGTQADAGAADWNLTLADAKGAAVKRVSGQGAPPARFDWDGKNNAGEKVAPGSYGAQLTVRDVTGQVASSRPLALTADPSGAPAESLAPAAKPSSLEEGTAYMKDGQWEKALDFFQGESAKNPKDPEPYRKTITCLFQLGRLEDAEKVSETLMNLR